MVVNLTSQMMTLIPNPEFLNEAERWEAVLKRDAQADGQFFYAVQTTGVYCRPSCASRQPRRGNVRFFPTWEAAEQAGFRACKRCNPNSPGLESDHRQAVLQACQMIETSETPPSLKELAQAAHLSLYYFQRLFKRIVGVSPKQYALERRFDKAQRLLQQPQQPVASVTEAMAAAGFASSSRFYQETSERLGMKPSTYKNGAGGMQIRYAVASCYLGWVLVASTEQGLCAIQFGDAPENLVQSLIERFPKADLHEHDASFEASLRKVLAYLETPRQPLDLPLDIQGTAFQRRVWQALREIPVGSTLSYSGLAAKIGHPKAARAVAQACATNKIAAVIPCHRVVREDGSLGGYRWGLQRKRALLDRERE